MLTSDVEQEGGGFGTNMCIFVFSYMPSVIRRRELVHVYFKCSKARKRGGKAN
jgi:hypothetical protein